MTCLRRLASRTADLVLTLFFGADDLGGYTPIPDPPPPPGKDALLEQARRENPALREQVRESLADLRRIARS